MRGRLPAQAGTKRARGNPGKRRVVDAPAGLVSADVPDSPPAELSPLARDVWTRLAPRLIELRFLRSTDMPAFSRYCTDAAHWWTCELDIRKRGAWYTTTSKHVENLERMNPSFKIQDRLHLRLLAAEDRFGLSPSARARLFQFMAATAGLPPDGSDRAAVLADQAKDVGSAAPLIGGLADGRVH